MQPKYQSDTSFQISLPASSVDWRFLLPITESSRVLIIGGEHDDFTELFGKIGVSAITWLHGSLPAKDENNSEQGKFDAVENLVAQSFPPMSFDFVVIPFGFPGDKLTHEVDVYQMIRRLIRPDGMMLIGFSNTLGLFRQGFRSDSFYSTPWCMMHKLRLAGYSQIDFYGAMPNLDTPEFIFPLKAQLLSFTLQHRYRYKLPAMLLYIFSSRPIATIFLYLLSYYFVIVKSNTETISDL